MKCAFVLYVKLCMLICFAFKLVKENCSLLDYDSNRATSTSLWLNFRGCQLTSITETEWKEESFRFNERHTFGNIELIFDIYLQLISYLFLGN